MAIKKKGKGRFAAKKTVIRRASGSIEKPFANEGFFQRMKEIIKSEMPQPEKVRVKTFIVEKPVIIHDRAQKYASDDDSVYDSKKSRYSRESIATGLGLVKQKKKPAEEEDYSQAGSEDEPVEEEPIEDGTEQTAGAEDEFSEGDNAEESEFSDDAPLSEDEPLETPSPAHTRSRGMFNNIWWKKALFWSILFWLFILAVSMAMQALKLITVDLTRQWWMLLAFILLIAMVYFKFLEGKLKI